MKNFLLRLGGAFLFCAMLAGVISCGNKNEEKPAPKQPQAVVTSKETPSLPNYRYVDADTILAKYNLAKDYNEEMTRMQDNMQSQVKKHENSIQSLATSMNNKMQNNGYLTEESFKADQDKLNSMQAQAQNEVAKLQSQFEAAFMASNKTVIDSIESFIKIYNEKKGYDAIFTKTATMYINPALDITDEIVEGLNARYNKVK